MRKQLAYLLLVVLACLGIGYVVLGPNVLLGGPSKAAIVDAARAAMIAAATTPAADSAARSATITPRGLCNRGGDATHACIVEVEVAGAPPQTLVTRMKKDASGVWVPAE